MLKKPKKPILVGFFRWVFLGGFFYCQPCLEIQLAQATEEQLLLRPEVGRMGESVRGKVLR